MNEVNRLIFKIELLKKVYGSIEAINIKKLEIHPGTIYALVGPPGSGKTTLLNILSGKEKQNSGNLYFESNPYKRNFFGKIIKPDEIFYNHGYEYYDSSLSIGNVITKLYGKKSKIITKRHFGKEMFKNILNRKISNLSNGELNWLGMVLALESDPRVLLIDDYGIYFTNEMEQEFRSNLRKMNRNLGTTIILSTPNESLIKNFASVIIYLNNGHISKIRSSSKYSHRKKRNSFKQQRSRNRKPATKHRNNNRKHKK